MLHFLLLSIILIIVIGLMYFLSILIGKNIENKEYVLGVVNINTYFLLLLSLIKIY